MENVTFREEPRSLCLWTLSPSTRTPRLHDQTRCFLLLRVSTPAYSARVRCDESKRETETRRGVRTRRGSDSSSFPLKPLFSDAHRCPFYSSSAPEGSLKHATRPFIAVQLGARADAHCSPPHVSRLNASPALLSA